MLLLTRTILPIRRERLTSINSLRTGDDDVGGDGYGDRQLACKKSDRTGNCPFVEGGNAKAPDLGEVPGGAACESPPSSAAPTSNSLLASAWCSL